jgi:hypothetical protein
MGSSNEVFRSATISVNDLIVGDRMSIDGLDGQPTVSSITKGPYEIVVALSDGSTIPYQHGRQVEIVLSATDDAADLKRSGDALTQCQHIAYGGSVLIDRESAKVTNGDQLAHEQIYYVRALEAKIQHLANIAEAGEADEDFRAALTDEAN